MDKQGKEEALDPSVDIKTCNLHTIRSSLETGAKRPKKNWGIKISLKINTKISIHLSIDLSVCLYLYIHTSLIQTPQTLYVTAANISEIPFGLRAPEN